MLEFRNKQIVIVGLRGTGKTVFAKYIIRKVKKHLVFDILNEYKPRFNRYIPKSTEVDFLKYEFCKLSNFLGAFKKLDLLAIDEANRIAPPRKALLPEIAELVDFGRHKALTVIYIARRPVQLHTDIIELADYLVIFKLSGKNDIRYLEDLRKGLGDEVLKLPKHYFIVLDKTRDFKIYPPIKMI